MSTAPVRPDKSQGSPNASPERDALDRVIRSDALHRAPNLLLFLRYVCEMQIAGRTDSIKEYNIAVEALGRGPDFDQKKDSIVRVEAHRLRKRLTEYYEGQGAADPVHIVLPPGSYVPVFQAGSSSPPAIESPIPQPASPTEALRPRSRIALVVLGVGLLCLLYVSTAFWPGRTAAVPMGSSPKFANALPSPGASSSVLRLAAGSPGDGFADGTGGWWQGDRYFLGGDAVTATSRNIRRTTDDSLYLTRREGEFEYRIPVEPGSYELRLHFAETVFGEDNVAGGGESSRVFQVLMNGSQPWTADIISEAQGANTAHIKVYRDVRPAPDGAIHVAFRPARKEAAFVNGIEVIPTPNHKLTPIRIVPRTSPVVVPSGDTWSADQYSLGGVTVQRHEEVAGPEPSLLYQSERYGSFSYAVPVAMGARYTLTLRFAETWFGEGRPGNGGIGARVFDVYCNGTALLRNFDVLREAGGPMRQVKRIFRNLEPSAQGVLNVQFVPIRNYAMVNSIEVVEDGR